MIGKKINQLATELAPVSTDLTIIGDPVSGVSKKITLAQLGAIFSGAVSFYNNLASFPALGDINVIYCAKDTKKLYLWDGSTYVEVFPAQALLDTYQLRSEKGVSNGYASLDSGGKVPISQLPSSIMEYKGTWNAATNTPTLANGTGDTGDVYICNVAGTVNFGAGPITFAVGDYVIYSGSIWQRSSGAVGTVTSVAVTRSGDALAITGSPITTSGTINIGFAGTGAQYIKGDGTLATFPSIISQAQNLITEVYNNTGATLTKGTIVYINGGQGNLPTVTKALATSDATSAQTYGVVQTDITNMNNGYVVVEGRLGDLDTQAYANGTQLYLSPTTAGTWTSTKPYAPNHLVYVGIVVRSHPTQGVVEVKIMNGFEMDELHNVAAQNPDNNDILQYKTATSLWTKVAGTTSNIAEGSNLYYTDARSRAALSFTAGSGAYNSTTGVITIPTNTNQLTNGAAFITLTSLAAGAGISYNNTTGVIASTITQYTDALARASISLTTTGTSGAATYNNTTGVLNIPQYQTALTNPVTGTGTTNYLPKFTGTSTIGNSVVQEASGFIGIGITPARILNIYDTNSATLYQTPTSGTGAGNGFYVGQTGDVSYIWNYNNFPIILATNNTPRLTLSASGNLGLGVTPSAWVSGVGRTALQVGITSVSTNAANDSFYGTNYYDDGSNNRYINSDFSLIYAQQNGNHIWYNAPSGTAGNAISFTQAMTLNASGNLFIGTTSATFPSSGRGYVVLNGSTDTVLEFKNADTLAGYLFQNSSALQIETFGSRSLSFHTANATRLTIASTGAATFSTSSTNCSIAINNTSNTPYIRFDESGAAKFFIGQRNSVSGDGGTGYDLYTVAGNDIRFFAGGTKALTLATTGAATFSSSVTATQLIATNQSTPNLYLSSNAGGTAVNFRITSNESSQQVNQVVESNHPLTFWTNSTERMRITSGGNLNFNYSGATAYVNINQATGADGGLLFLRSINNRWQQNLSIPGDNFQFYSYGVGNTVLSLNYSTGAATFSSTLRANSEIYTYTGSNFGYWGVDNGNSYVYLGTNSSGFGLSLQTAGSERMRITSGGNVEIATGSIKTGEPDTGWGRAAIKIGASVSGAAFNVTRYLPVNVDGTVYFINLNSSTP